MLDYLTAITDEYKTNFVRVVEDALQEERVRERAMQRDVIELTDIPELSPPSSPGSRNSSMIRCGEQGLSTRTTGWPSVYCRHGWTTAPVGAHPFRVVRTHNLRGKAANGRSRRTCDHPPVATDR
jgi:hypothetical protein